MTINYAELTPAQRHFAGRLHRMAEQVHDPEGFTIRALKLPSGRWDLIALELVGSDRDWTGDLTNTYWRTYRLEDGSGNWAMVPTDYALASAGYNTRTGEVVDESRSAESGIVLPTDAVETALMELPEGWTDTAILMALELAGMAPDTVLNHSQLARVIEALTECEDAERVALWVTDLQSYSHTLAEAIEDAEDWVRREAGAFTGHWHNGAEYAEEYVTDYQHIPDVLDGCIDWDAVWDSLSMDMSYTEDGGEIYVYED